MDFLSSFQVSAQIITSSETMFLIILEKMEVCYPQLFYGSYLLRSSAILSQPAGL